MRALLVLLLPAAAGADATVTFYGSKGWADVVGARAPTFTIAGQRLSAVPDSTQQVKLTGSRKLVEATLAGLHFRLTFLTDLQDGHHYAVRDDPCCFVEVTDEHDDLVRYPAHARCARGEKCPAGTRLVSSFVYRDRDRCGDEPSCLRPLRMRSTTPLSVVVDDQECEDPTPIGPEYRVVASSSRESPQCLCVFRGGKLVWKGQVLLRLDHRYTVMVGDGAPELRIDD